MHSPHLCSGKWFTAKDFPFPHGLHELTDCLLPQPPMHFPFLRSWSSLSQRQQRAHPSQPPNPAPSSLVSGHRHLPHIPLPHTGLFLSLVSSSRFNKKIHFAKCRRCLQILLSESPLHCKKSSQIHSNKISLC